MSVFRQTGLGPAPPPANVCSIKFSNDDTRTDDNLTMETESLPLSLVLPGFNPIITMFSCAQRDACVRDQHTESMLY